MIFPEDVGFPIGETSTVQYYMVEVHYDNPDRLEGVSFETGLAMYYTTELRPIDAGILAIGQGVDISLTIPPNQDAFKVVGHCSPQCTYEALEPEGITVFASMLHSHKSGKLINKTIKKFKDISGFFIFKCFVWKTILS